MKFFSAILLAGFLAFASQAHAYVDSAKGVRLLDSQGTISVSTYTTVVSSLTKAVKGITVSNTAASSLVLAIGAASSEQDQLVIPGGGTPGALPAPVFYPIALSQGLRVSIKARDSAAAIGEQNFNFLYY